MIYLASPLTHDDPNVLRARFHAACYAAGVLMTRGLHVFSPIAHTYPIFKAVLGLPVGWDYWAAFDRKMIEACTHLQVLQIDGWVESKGVQAEIQIAKELPKPVGYIDASSVGLSRILPHCDHIEM